MNTFDTDPEVPESSGPDGPWFVRVPALPLRALHSAWAEQPGCLLLESGCEHPATGRYSFLMRQPVHWLLTHQSRLQDWQQLRDQVAWFRTDAGPDLPPFIGGAAGLVSYDWCRAMEHIESPRRDDFQVPGLAMGVYDVVIAWDHVRDASWIISTGYPQPSGPSRRRVACDRLKETWRQVEAVTGNTADQSPGRQWDIDRGKNGRSASYQSAVLDQSRYFPMDPDREGVPVGLLTATRMEDYRQSIERAIEYLRAGDIFQVNLSQQLVAPIPDSAAGYYQRLRVNNPAPMMAYFNLGNHQIVSASPERLFSVRDQWVETRPIKGTCPRTGTELIDELAAKELRASGKNCAENIMIVDLLRNDLSLVCEDRSVQVTELCSVEPYQFVQHLTSVVRGRLVEGNTAWDVMPAIFPGGSISGAPKVRAMEIINELEPVARGAYCGSLGYLSFAGDGNAGQADWSILIRTATVCGQWCQIPVGGGIVLDSDPESEFQETLTKARGMLVSLTDTDSPQAMGVRRESTESKLATAVGRTPGSGDPS